MSFRIFWVCSVAGLLLFSCSSTVEKKPHVSEKTSSKEVTEIVKDATYYLRQAKQSYAKSRDSYRRDALLLSAAEAFQAEKSCDKSIKMLQVLKAELESEQLKRQAKLIIAECYVTLEDAPIDDINSFLTNLPIEASYIGRVNILKAELYARKKQWLFAASSLLKTSTPELEKSQQIWKWITQLNLRELEQGSLQQPDLQPWLQLAIINQRFALDPKVYKQQVLAWQSRNIEYSIASNLPDEVIQMLQLEAISPRKIAVLVPLSGRLASQGLAIKKGILASYLQDLQNVQIEDRPEVGKNTHISEKQFKEIRFFDSALKTPEELNVFVADFDVVIGPLVKEKLAGLKAILPTDKVLLGLNRLEVPTQSKTPANFSDKSVEPAPSLDHFFFSLAPEDEAEQLARHMHKSQLVHPVIFAADGSTTQRMAQAFISEWDKLSTGIHPELTTFKNNKDMRDKVSSVLDVAQSKARIRQIEYLADVEVFGVERNRRDIDAIVLFASPEQTELLNPIIEASLSPFARKSLSVFASSRSYSIDVNQNSLRDLRNLTFTDMPWMLPNHNWVELSTQVNELWPQEKDSLLRLFAMGIDAYNLLPQLRTLKLLPEINSNGLTGSINIDSNGVLHRHLPWAQVMQDKVKLLAMD